MTAEEIARDTYDWLKNIKAISAFTGEDAKRAKERADQAVAQTQVYAKLREEAGGDPVKMAQLIKGFESQLMALTDKEQLAFMQQRATGVISQKDFRIADAETGGIMQRRIDKAVELSKTEADATKFMDFSKQNAPALLDAIYKRGGTGMANLLGGKFGAVEELKAAIGRQMLIQQGILENTNKTVNNAANTQDKLTLGVSEGMIEWQNKQIEIAQKLDTPLRNFVDEMNDHIIPALEEALQSAGIAGLFNNQDKLSFDQRLKQLNRGGQPTGPTYDKDGKIIRPKPTTTVGEVDTTVLKGLTKDAHLAENVSKKNGAFLNNKPQMYSEVFNAINAIALMHKGKNVTITAGDDEYHRSKEFQRLSPSMFNNGVPNERNTHAMGLAADLVVSGADMKSEVDAINQKLRELNVKARVAYEDKGSTPGATGSHLHITDENSDDTKDAATKLKQKKAGEQHSEVTIKDLHEVMVAIHEELQDQTPILDKQLKEQRSA